MKALAILSVTLLSGCFGVNDPAPVVITNTVVVPPDIPPQLFDPCDVDATDRLTRADLLLLTVDLGEALGRCNAQLAAIQEIIAGLEVGPK